MYQKQRGRRRNILPSLLSDQLCSLVLHQYCLLAKPVGKCCSLQSRSSSEPENKPAGDYTVVFLKCRDAVFEQISVWMMVPLRRILWDFLSKL